MDRYDTGDGKSTILVQNLEGGKIGSTSRERVKSRKIAVFFYLSSIKLFYLFMVFFAFFQRWQRLL